MTDQPNKDEIDCDWEACQPGTLSKVVQKTEAFNRRQLMIKVGTSAAGIIALAGGSVYLLRDKDEEINGDAKSINNGFDNTNVIARIRCKTVIDLLPEYLAGEIDDKTLLARIDDHLGYCRPCISIRDEMA